HCDHAFRVDKRSEPDRSLRSRYRTGECSIVQFQAHMHAGYLSHGLEHKIAHMIAAATISDRTPALVSPVEDVDVVDAKPHGAFVRLHGHGQASVSEERRLAPLCG